MYWNIHTDCDDEYFLTISSDFDIFANVAVSDGVKCSSGESNLTCRY